MIIGESCPRACDTLSTPVSAANTNSGRLVAHAAHDLVGHLAIDLQPAGDVAG